MTLYADMLFLVNFIMNSFVLWVVSKLVRGVSRQKKKNLWIMLGAAVMSLLYTLLIAVEALRFVNVALSSVVILTAGLLITFRLSGWRGFLKLVAVAYCISFAVGGLGMALFFLTDVPYAVYFIANDFGGFTRAISWQLVLVGTAASYVLIKIGLHIAKMHSLKRQMICTVQIHMGEQGTAFDALVDTGHSLKEPLSQHPVIIAEFEHVKDFLPDRLKVMFYERQEDDLTGLMTEGSAFYKRIRMIPFTSLGRKSGMLIGFRPDRVAVEGAKEAPANVVIGIYNDKLCNDGKYQGLLSPEILA